MTTKEFILKLIKYCCFGLLLFGVFVLSFGCGFYYRDSGHTMQVNTQSLYPQDIQTNVSEFLSSPFLLPFSPVISGTRNTVDNISFCNMQFKLFSDGTVFNLSYKIAGSYLHVEGQSINNAVSFNDLPWSTFVVSNDGAWHDKVLRDWSGYPLDNTYDFLVTYFCQSSFVSNVSYVVISQVTNIFGLSLSGVELKFFDINSNYFQIILLGPSGIYFNSFLDYVPSRTVYFVSDLTNNDYYQNGYSDGYAAGDSYGQSVGYDTGYNVGFGNGDLVGYQRGIEDSNQYTFLNLIGAVIDAPITAFVNLLDFNVLGFNMLNLCCSLLTLSLIILVVKFVLFRS